MEKVSYFLNKEDQEPLLEKILDENELLVVNDRKVFTMQPN